VTFTIRPEQPADQDAIYNLTKVAFAPMPYAGGDEQDLVNALRSGGALTLSLIAVRDEEPVGHVAFSPATAADNSPNWYALGPVSVHPDYQGQGIGASLIRAGIDHFTQVGAAGIILTGNPKYYARFGFLPFPEFAPSCEPAQYFMILPLATTTPHSKMAFHPLFYANGGLQH
jgi:putative acetyltransferase